ncbi:hypothetical protein V6N11_010360 [Hibiscus sabdariffa]|uniref:Uncharacterized protein n=2 Tax=Hibiscus sabdariffa TaxID=183260 RepID=A0ABR2A217_9ROSI
MPFFFLVSNINKNSLGFSFPLLNFHRAEEIPFEINYIRVFSVLLIDEREVLVHGGGGAPSSLASSLISLL